MRTNRRCTAANWRAPVLAIVVGLLTGGGSASRADETGKPSGPAKVEVRKSAGRFQLHVDSKPFYIKGAGIELGSPEKLKEHGGNSFRTWSTDNGRDSGKQVRGFTPQAIQKLTAFHWPGNVRELENTIERSVMLSTGTALDAVDIALDSQPPAGRTDAAPTLPPGVTLEQWEDEIIREALRRAGGNKSQAARALGLSRNALRYRLSKIDVPDSAETDF